METVGTVIIKISGWICQCINCCCYSIEVLVGAHDWLLIDHLHLPPALLCNLATKLVCPYPVVKAIGDIVFYL